MIVPIGIKAATNMEITISENIQNLPTGLKVFLEDRDNNTYTLLENESHKFKTTLTED